MAKGYWIVFGDVSDPEGYKAYQAANAAPLKQYGARFLVRGGAKDVVEGATRSRAVVIEFPTHQAAVDCYHSPGYQAALALRRGRAEIDLTIVEGYDGPQPND